MGAGEFRGQITSFQASTNVGMLFSVLIDPCLGRESFHLSLIPVASRFDMRLSNGIRQLAGACADKLRMLPAWPILIACFGTPSGFALKGAGNRLASYIRSCAWIGLVMLYMLLQSN